MNFTIWIWFIFLMGPYLTSGFIIPLLNALLGGKNPLDTMSMSSAGNNLNPGPANQLMKTSKIGDVQQQSPQLEEYDSYETYYYSDENETMSTSGEDIVYEDDETGGVGNKNQNLQTTTVTEEDDDYSDETEDDDASGTKQKEAETMVVTSEQDPQSKTKGKSTRTTKTTTREYVNDDTMTEAEETEDDTGDTTSNKKTSRRKIRKKQQPKQEDIQEIKPVEKGNSPEQNSMKSTVVSKTGSKSKRRKSIGHPRHPKKTTTTVVVEVEDDEPEPRGKKGTETVVIDPAKSKPMKKESRKTNTTSKVKEDTNDNTRPPTKPKRRRTRPKFRKSERNPVIPKRTTNNWGYDIDEPDPARRGPENNGMPWNTKMPDSTDGSSQSTNRRKVSRRYNGRGRPRNPPREIYDNNSGPNQGRPAENRKYKPGDLSTLPPPPKLGRIVQIERTEYKPAEEPPKQRPKIERTVVDEPPRYSEPNNNSGPRESNPDRTRTWEEPRNEDPTKGRIVITKTEYIDRVPDSGNSPPNDRSRDQGTVMPRKDNTDSTNSRQSGWPTNQGPDRGYDTNNEYNRGRPTDTTNRDSQARDRNDSPDSEKGRTIVVTKTEYQDDQSDRSSRNRSSDSFADGSDQSRDSVSGQEENMRAGRARMRQGQQFSTQDGQSDNSRSTTTSRRYRPSTNAVGGRSGMDTRQESTQTGNGNSQRRTKKFRTIRRLRNPNDSNSRRDYRDYYNYWRRNKYSSEYYD